MSRARHWAYIAETGTILGMRILIFAYRLGGAALFKWMLFPVISFYYMYRANSRKASREYLERVNRKTAQFPKVGNKLVFKHFWEFGLSLIDKFAVWMGKVSPQQVIIHNAELIDTLVADNRGAVIAISHLGNFEIINAMSQRHRGVKLTILHHTHHAEKFNRVLNQYAKNRQVELVQVTELDAGLAVRLSEKVGRGEFIAIACDRIPVNNPNAIVDCEFLGELAPFPIGPYVLAQALAVPLLALFCIRKLHQYHVYFEPLSEAEKWPRAQRDTFIQQTAQRFAQRLEAYACRHPLQWFNFYDFWARPNVKEPLI